MPLGRPSIVQPGAMSLAALQQFASNVRERFGAVEAAIAAQTASSSTSPATTASLLSITAQIAALTRRVAALESEEFAQIDVLLEGESGEPLTATPPGSLGTSFLIDATDDFTLLPITAAESGRNYTIIITADAARTLTIDNNYLTTTNILSVSLLPDTSTLIRATANTDLGSGQMVFLCTIDENMSFIDIRGTEDGLDVRITEDGDTRIAE